MAKTSRTTDGRTMFLCPACVRMHWVNARAWEISGDSDCPTFEPSIMVLGTGRCHSFVRNGRIEYLSDSDHKLAGQTVDMIDLELIDADYLKELHDAYAI